MHLFEVGLTDHLEGPRDQPSAVIFDELADLVGLADRLGVRYAWFSEHHDHAHFGHMPTPLLFALDLAGQTRDIRLGTAIICLNLHHPLDVAEQVAVADLLTKGRMAVGFGSGSTPEEFRLFGLAETEDQERHARFAEALRLIRSAWSGMIPEAGTDGSSRYYSVPSHRPLPVPAADLAGRSWVAVNSLGSARIAGSFNFNMLSSHLRTPEQYGNTPPPIARLWHTIDRRQSPGVRRPGRPERLSLGRVGITNAVAAISGRRQDPRRDSRAHATRGLGAHPINFIVGGPDSVARELRELHEQAPFDVADVEVRGPGCRPSSSATACDG